MSDGISLGVPYKLADRVTSGFCGTIISKKNLKNDAVSAIKVSHLLKFPQREQEERLKQYMQRFKTPA